jgi:ankyrin repeat protein
MRVLTAALLLLIPNAAWAQPAPTPRAAILRALPILQRSAKTFVDKRGCVSCHHNILPILTLHLAQERGFKIDTNTLAAIEDKTFRELTSPTAIDDAIQGVNVNDPTPNDSWLLMAAHAANRPHDVPTETYARRLVRWQRTDHWTTSDFRPPHSSSDFTATATAIYALTSYMPDTLEAERELVIAQARSWLTATKPRSTEDAAFRLMGLAWAHASTRDLATAQHDLLAMQSANGGWPQLNGYPSDAYSTGEALYALSESRVATTEPGWQRGQRFLLSTQAADGTWRVRTRMQSPADVSPPPFNVAFPYGKDAFLSYAGTSWAVMALLKTLPATADARRARAAVPAPADEAWLRTALFGSRSELAARLDAGLDPNMATTRGTTLLMAAAGEPEKVALLLKRGAHAATRASSGADAVTVASTYSGTRASIGLLLDAGAAPAPPENVHVRRSPLVYAAMSGDTDTVSLLLARGAPASSEALAESITFNNIDVTKALLTAGANATGKESSGVTLLHWAVIANRPNAIPLLKAAGVDINAKDNAGYTPLMYAATVDMGHTELVSALLAAGADRAVRNKTGRTPLQQALFLKHTQLAIALR